MSDVEEKINKIITESILPSVQMHGGHVELQSFKDGIVTVFLSGACSGCAMSTLTLKMGIENMLKKGLRCLQRYLNGINTYCILLYPHRSV